MAVVKALNAVARSITKQIVNPFRQTFTCIVIYGLPLLLAWVLFPLSFSAILHSFMIFVGVVFVASRLEKRKPSRIAERFVRAQEVRFDAEGVSQIVDGGQSSWPWSHLSRLHIVESTVVLEFYDWSWVSLPDRLWPDQNAMTRFVDKVRTQAEGLLPDLPSDSVPTPFTVVNVGAGFAAMDLFLLQIFGVTWAALSPLQWPSAIGFALGSVPQALGVLFAAALSLAVLGFFVVRRVLRKLEQRYPHVAIIVANLFIWPVPLGLAVKALIH